MRSQKPESPTSPCEVGHSTGKSDRPGRRNLVEVGVLDYSKVPCIRPFRLCSSGIFSGLRLRSGYRASVAAGTA